MQIAFRKVHNFDISNTFIGYNIIVASLGSLFRDKLFLGHLWAQPPFNHSPLKVFPTYHNSNDNGHAYETNGPLHFEGGVF